MLNCFLSKIVDFVIFETFYIEIPHWFVQKVIKLTKIVKPMVKRQNSAL